MELNNNMKLKIVLIIMILITAVSSYSWVDNKYDTAHQLYMKSNYVMAIKHFDSFLETSQNGALSTQAELERSDCYYQLGSKAYVKENWLLAARLFFLSNSEIADLKLDDCYFMLAQQQLEQNALNATLKYYEKITSYLKGSEHIPELLFNRIKIYIEIGNNLAAFEDYHFLWMNYPESNFTKDIQPSIDDLMPVFINDALALKDSMEYDLAVESFTKLSQYPSTFQHEMFVHISELYLLKAEMALVNKEYTLVRENLDLALDNNKEIQIEIDNIIRDICSSIIQEGNELINIFKFDEAIEVIKSCYIMIPEYEPCFDLINDTEDKKQRYQAALEHENSAINFETEKNFSAAYSDYNKSYNLFNTNRVKEKIFIMGNLIQAEKDPKEFAMKIINSYKNGIIPLGVSIAESSVIAQYGDEVKNSGWKVYYAIGEYKYEVRFDILSPDENYYYSWRVNLKTRKITSLNNISEDVLKGKVHE